MPFFEQRLVSSTVMYVYVLLQASSTVLTHVFVFSGLGDPAASDYEKKWMEYVSVGGAYQVRMISTHSIPLLQLLTNLCASTVLHVVLERCDALDTGAQLHG